MPFDHVIAGLHVRADCRIPHAAVAPAGFGVDVRVHFASAPPWFGTPDEGERAPWIGDDAGASGLRGWTLRSGAFFQIAYDDDTTFVIDSTGREVWVSWPPPLTLEDASTYLLGPVLGFLLRLRGAVCLHASAVVVGGSALALVGDPGYGKSTTAAALARQGFPVLSDDVVVLRDEGDTLHVVPSYPQLKLWPDSTAFLFGAPDALERITPTHPTWDKRYADPTTGNVTFAQHNVPLGAVYMLQPRSDDPAAPHVGELPPRARLTALLENTYAAQYVDTAGHARALPVLARLASTVPVRTVTPHADPARIGLLCDAILDDFAGHAGRVPAAAAR